MSSLAARKISEI